jgi:Tfp pilus assembly protein PilF
LNGSYREAIDAFRQAIKVDPSYKRIYNNLGLVLAKINKYKEAMQAFRSGGDEAQAYNNLGCVYLLKSKKDKAIRAFEKAIEAKPTFYGTASDNLQRTRYSDQY